MRSALAKAFAGTSVAVVIVAGSLAGASASFASTPQTAVTAVVRPLVTSSVDNLGLDTTHAKTWQICLNEGGYDAGTVDGELGTTSWKAAQRMLNAAGFDAGTVDGIVGTNTIKALQRLLNYWGWNAGAVDGVAGSQTESAFWNYTTALAHDLPCG